MSEAMTEVKPITLTDQNGRKYILEFNRAAIQFAEARGFILEEVAKFPMTKIPEFFYYAFYMHHKGITKEKTDKLLSGIGELPEGFLERLVSLYAVPLNTLTTGDGKNGKVLVDM